MKMSRGPFFKVCLFVFVCLFFSLLKPLKFVCGVPKWKFLPKQKHFTKKLGNVTLPPLKNIPLTPLYRHLLWGGGVF